MTPTAGIELRINAEWSQKDRRYVVIHVVFDRSLEHGGISAVDIRETAVMQILENYLPEEISVNGKPIRSVVTDSKPEDWNALDKADQLRRAARTYALARLVGRSPLKELAKWLGASQSTAARLAAQARSSGLLD